MADASVESELAGYREHLVELNALLEEDPGDVETAELVKEVKEAIAELQGAQPWPAALADEPAPPPPPPPPLEQERDLAQDRDQDQDQDAKVQGVANGAVEKRRKKKKPKDNALEERANAWQAFNGKGGKKKKSMFSSPAEGAVGRVGFHGSKNTRTENPERKRWK